VAINKADIDPDAALRAEAQITSSLRLLGLHGNPDHAHHDEKLWHPRVVKISALLGQGVDGFWSAVREYRRVQTDNGRLSQRRQQQSLAWMWERLDAGLKQRFRNQPRVQALLPTLTAQVASGHVPPSTAARQLLNAYEAQG
jgi:LAO/AO transport system kinase